MLRGSRVPSPSAPVLTHSGWVMGADCFCAGAQALAEIDRRQLIEMRTEVKPPPAVERVAAAVMVLLTNSAGPEVPRWITFRQEAANIDKFMGRLASLDRASIAGASADHARTLLEGLLAAPHTVAERSPAARQLLAWAGCALGVHDVYRPLGEARRAQEARDREADELRAKIAALEKAASVCERSRLPSRPILKCAPLCICLGPSLLPPACRRAATTRDRGLRGDHCRASTQRRPGPAPSRARPPHRTPRP